MIFEGRSLDEISDEEIADLVEDRVAEQQHLEFKATFKHKEPAARMELLRDVVSMVNGGGGYLVLGVQDDGRGRAKDFVGPAIKKHSDSIMKSIRSLCHDHIAERIEGIEIRLRDVNGNPVVAVRVPESARCPHMVTLNRGTHFTIRVEDGKREMSMAEIREAILTEPLAQRLYGIDARLSDLTRAVTRDEQKKQLAEALHTQASDVLARMDDGRLLAEIQRERFENEVGTTPFLWLSVTPVAPRQSLIDVDKPEIVGILSKPPGSRRDGWNMRGLDHNRQQSVNGVGLGTKEYRYLEVFENGHLEFWAPLNGHFCRRQSESERNVRPSLNPYPVVEYPVSFLRLATALTRNVSYSEEMLVQLEYRNASGYVLRPGRPESMLFHSPFDASIPFAKQHIRVEPIQVPAPINPDEIAFDLLKVVYRAFGLKVAHIPFRDANGVFSFGR